MNENEMQFKSSYYSWHIGTYIYRTNVSPIFSTIVKMALRRFTYFFSNRFWIIFISNWYWFGWQTYDDEIWRRCIQSVNHHISIPNKHNFSFILCIRKLLLEKLLWLLKKWTNIQFDYIVYKINRNRWKNISFFTHQSLNHPLDADSLMYVIVNCKRWKNKMQQLNELHVVKSFACHSKCICTFQMI